MRSRKRVFTLCITLLLLVLLIGWIAWGNTALELNTISVYSDRLPKGFAGYRVAHVSDLHNAELGNDNSALLAMLKSAQPDIIAITGDIVDSYRTNTDTAVAFAEQAVLIAPCYYVTGNHESRLDEELYRTMEEQLMAIGVTVLHGETVTLERGGDTISLAGIDDPDFAARYGTTALAAADGYTLLLSHRPELLTQYHEAEMDLVLSGHAHGGQFRLPFIGGVFAPDQGFFPAYDAGLYTSGNTQMVVSRGIGNSLFPFRVNNRPEVILIELQTTRE